MISVTSAEHTVSTVRIVCHQGSRSESKQPQPTDDVRDNKYRSDLVGPCSMSGASAAAADDADGADANAAFRLG
jgi:hypothetical protein